MGHASLSRERIKAAVEILWHYYARAWNAKIRGNAVHCRTCERVHATLKASTAQRSLEHSSDCNVRLMVASDLATVGLALPDGLEEDSFETWQRTQDRITGEGFYNGRYS